MSRASHTPIPFFMKMTIRELFRWIDSMNEVEAEEEKESGGQEEKTGGESSWQGHRKNLNCFSS